MILLPLLEAAAAMAMPPADWAPLPPLRYVAMPAESADVANYVRAEVKAGRCSRAAAGPAGTSVSVDMAVLATPAGMPRRVVPRAIDCPSVEQYAAGIVTRRAIANIATDGATADTWYRTSITFTWPD